VLFETTRHRYTEALMASIPRPTPTRRLTTIEGRPPDLRQPPDGCRFHPRCPHATPVCAIDTPAWTVEADDHGYECHAPAGAATGDRVVG
jgi:oligopeptide/dipeptide ABC transporter ATP-binding protein